MSLARSLSLGLALTVLPACGASDRPADATPDMAAGAGDPGEELPPLSPVPSAWRFEHPLPQGNTLYGVWVGPGEAWAVGDRGAVVHVTGAAATQEATGATPAALRAVLPVGQAIWAVGDSGSVLRGEGGRWQGLRAGDRPLHAIWAIGGVVSCAGQGSTAWRAEGGRLQPIALPGWRSGDVVRAAATDGEDVYLVGSGGRVLHGVADRWFLEADGLTSLDLLAVTVVEGGAVYAAGAGGRVLRRDPQSRRWGLDHPQGDSALTRAELRAVFSAAGAVYALAADGQVLRRGDTGWSLDQGVPTPVPVRGGGGGPAGAYAVGDAGLLLTRGPAAGAPWQPPPSAGQLTSAALLGVAAEGAVAYAVAENGLILRREGAGEAAAWRLDHKPSPSPGQPLFGVAVHGGEAYAVGSGGVILRRVGASWQAETYSWPDRRPDWKAVTILASGDVLAVGGAAGAGIDAEAAILHKSGATWQRELVSPRVLHALYAVGGDGQAVLAVGTKGTILRRMGTVWVPEDMDRFNDVELFAVGAAGGALYAAGTGGAVLERHMDSGMARWERTTVPGVGTLAGLLAGGGDLYAVGADGLSARRVGATWSLESTRASGLLSGLALAGDDLLAIGSGGAVLRRPVGAR